MEIKLKNLTEIQQILDGIPEETNNAMRIVIKKGMRDIVLQASKNHRFKSRSGLLVKSISQEYDDKEKVGKVFLDLGVAPYGLYIHEGTKKREQPIRPTNKRALRWVQNGNFVFAKSVNKPLKADRFLYEASDVVRPKFTKYLSEEIKKVGAK